MGTEFHFDLFFDVLGVVTFRPGVFEWNGDKIKKREDPARAGHR